MLLEREQRWHKSGHPAVCSLLSLYTCLCYALSPRFMQPWVPGSDGVTFTSCPLWNRLLISVHVLENRLQCGQRLTLRCSLSRYDTYKEELSTVVSGAASHNLRVAAKKAAKEAAKEHHEG